MKKKIKFTQLEWMIIVCFSSMALMSYLTSFIAGIINVVYGPDQTIQIYTFFFLIIGSLNTLVVIQIVKLFAFFESLKY